MGAGGGASRMSRCRRASEPCGHPPRWLDQPSSPKSGRRTGPCSQAATARPMHCHVQSLVRRWSFASGGPELLALARCRGARGRAVWPAAVSAMPVGGCGMRCEVCGVWQTRQEGSWEARRLENAAVSQSRLLPPLGCNEVHTGPRVASDTCEGTCTGHIRGTLPRNSAVCKRTLR